MLGKARMEKLRELSLLSAGVAGRSTMTGGDCWEKKEGVWKQ
jgi:hypothetical protein